MHEGVYRQVGDEAARDTVTVDFVPLRRSLIGCLFVCHPRATRRAHFGW